MLAQDRSARVGDAEILGAFDVLDAGVHVEVNARLAAEAIEKLGHLDRAFAAEELAMVLFHARKPVLFEEFLKGQGSEAAQCGDAELRIGGQKVLRAHLGVPEIAATASRDFEFLAGLGVVGRKQRR